MEYDSQKMILVLDSFPKQCSEAVSIAKDVRINGNFEGIAVCGMGGSGIGGELLKSIVTDMPVYPIHGYELPKYIDNKILVVLVSYSGNTEETLSCLEEAKRRGCKFVSITSGGKLAELDKNAVKIPGGYQPRNSIGYLFLTMVAILSNSKIIPDQSGPISEVLGILNSEECKKEGLLLAQKLENKIPLFYASDLLASAAYRIKTAVNENSKQPAFFHSFPEMNHNEINGFGKNASQIAAVFLSDRNDSEQIRKRMEITKDLIKGDVDIHDINVKGKSLLARMMYSIYVGDYMSYYLALINQKDPTPVPLIETLKKRLLL